jgi:hypothetical protein
LVWNKTTPSLLRFDWGQKCRLQKIVSDTLRGACKTRAQPSILGRRRFWLRWPKIGNGWLSEKQVLKAVTSIPIPS